MLLIKWLLSAQGSGQLLLGMMAVQGAFIMRSPGSLRLQKPEGGALAWIYNIFNLGFMLILTPLIAFELLGLINVLDWSHTSLLGTKPVVIMRMTGFFIYLIGCILICWSRVVLGINFRLGAVRPGHENRLITSGPFCYVRHPMYTAVILTSLGLSLISNSWFIFILTILFIFSIIKVIRIEEAQLEVAYQDDFRAWRKNTWCLVPWVY